MKVKSSAAGSLMLLGEHAVLHGEWAICCAIDKRIYVTIEEAQDVEIVSSIGIYHGQLGNLHFEEKFGFILSAIDFFKPEKGFRITVESEFSHKVGLGSSSAVIVAVCSALAQYVGKKLSKFEIFNSALEVMLSIQKCGSGADLAAAVFGGIVAIRMKGDAREVLPLQVKELPKISLYFCGYKMPTVEVIKHVASLREKNTEIYDHLYKLMGEVSTKAIELIEGEKWAHLATLFNIYQGLMDALGVCDLTLSQIVYKLRKKGFSSKISGSGLGDCVLALGEVNLDGVERIALAISSEGLCE